MLRRSRKRRRIALLVFLSVIAALLIAWPIVSELSRSPSEKLILTANDLGSGWYGTSVSSESSRSPGATDSASIRMTYNGSILECFCTLTTFSAVEYANASYERTFEGYSAEINQHDGPVNVTVGDRATFIVYQNDDGEAWDVVLVMQKGTAIASIALITYDGPSIDPSLNIELAEIQAAKLP